MGSTIRRRCCKRPRRLPGPIEWIEGALATCAPVVDPDLIYSNATLHWVPDHAELFPRLAGFLKAGGCLAVQMPLSFDAPSHRLMRETLLSGSATQRVGSRI